MSEYTSSIALASRLIAKKGELVLLRRFPLGAENVAKPWKPLAASPAQEEATVRAVFLDLQLHGREPIRYADGTLARVGDKEIYLAAYNLAFPPDLTSVLVRTNGEVWSVKAFDELNPGGEQIMYTLKATR